jgi:hypothetical protein
MKLKKWLVSKTVWPNSGRSRGAVFGRLVMGVDLLTIRAIRKFSECVNSLRALRGDSYSQNGLADVVLPVSKGYARVRLYGLINLLNFLTVGHGHQEQLIF